MSVVTHTQCDGCNVYIGPETGAGSAADHLIAYGNYGSFVPSNLGRIPEDAKPYAWIAVRAGTDICMHCIKSLVLASFGHEPTPSAKP